MDALAKAVVDAFAFLELSGDDVVDPDSAVSAMEMLAATLQACSAEERIALARAAQDEWKAQKSRKASKNTLEFYKDFMENLGLDETGE